MNVDYSHRLPTAPALRPLDLVVRRVEIVLRYWSFSAQVYQEECTKRRTNLTAELVQLRPVTGPVCLNLIVGVTNCYLENCWRCPTKPEVNSTTAATSHTLFGDDSAVLRRDTIDQ